jgi:predicted RNA binding protein with dsRBD fold (UPF0201 family)
MPRGKASLRTLRGPLRESKVVDVARGLLASYVAQIVSANAWVSVQSQASSAALCVVLKGLMSGWMFAIDSECSNTMIDLAVGSEQAPRVRACL